MMAHLTRDVQLRYRALCHELSTVMMLLQTSVPEGEIRRIKEFQKNILTGKIYGPCDLSWVL